MNAQQALADLTEISSQIQAAVVFDESGEVAGSTLGDDQGAVELARSAAELLARADEIAAGNGSPTQLEVATLEGSVFVVREGQTRIAATTAPEPTVGLVFYDLKSALRQVTTKSARQPAQKKTAPARKKSTSAKKTTTARKKPATRRKKSDAS